MCTSELTLMTLLIPMQQQQWQQRVAAVVGQTEKGFDHSCIDAVSAWCDSCKLYLPV